MLRALWVTLLATGLLACAWMPEDMRAQNKKEEKGKVIELDGMKVAIPGSWKQEEKESVLRFLQFRLPKVKDDKEDGMLIVHKGIGGSPEVNIKRLKEEMIPPEGKTLNDICKVTDFKIGDVKCIYLDASGTYKVVNRPGYRLLAIYYKGKDDAYVFRLYGPADTVASHKKGFEDWLKALKK